MTQLKLCTPPQSQGISAVRSSPVPQALTIGRLARAADVGVETIRYYQERQLLPVPPSSGAFRYYPVSLIERIRFIKHAQELGFSLGEVGELLQLEDGADRSSIRRIAADRLLQGRDELVGGVAADGGDAGPGVVGEVNGHEWSRFLREGGKRRGEGCGGRPGPPR